MNRDGIEVAKAADFSEWYGQTIRRGGLIQNHDVSGCYVLRPPAMFIWESIQEYVNKSIKKMGVRNAQFPMFVTKDRLETEKEHVAGFSPEVAWVTRAGDKDLPVPIAVRPTSETIMYPHYAQWIRNYKDLPLKLNQWCNVVRWEFKQPTPFIRTREFLWQEGHTAHATEECAKNMVFSALNVYKAVYEDILAVPVIQGYKSEKEKFAGAVMTTTVEAFIPDNGRAVQAATSHYLGNHFSKMFGIEFIDENNASQFALQTSWGLTTRSIGVMVMSHGDDKGLVLPPKVAEIQVVVVNIPPRKNDDSPEARANIIKRCAEVRDMLEKAEIRVHFDDRDDRTPGYKFNQWELQGVPIRIEVGLRDVAQGVVTLVRRDTGNKRAVENVSAEAIELELKQMHADMLAKQQAKLEESIVRISCWDEVMPALNNKKLILAPWCEDLESEEEIKKLTAQLSKDQVKEDASGEAPALSGSMKTLCIPFETSGFQEPLAPGTKCFFTGKPAKRWTLWGRSY